METMFFDNLDDLRKYCEFLDTLRLKYSIKCIKQYCASLKAHYYEYRVNVYLAGDE